MTFVRISSLDRAHKIAESLAAPPDGLVTSRALFGDDRPLHFEIGFGGGEHMAYRANLLPDHGFIGCEPFLHGVAQALTHVAPSVGGSAEKPDVSNVRIHHGDALEVRSGLNDYARGLSYDVASDRYCATTDREPGNKLTISNRAYRFFGR